MSSLNSYSNFGRSMLEKYGWAEGKGLGRDEDGIAKPIKVNGNFSGIGLGLDVGQEFKNQWWDYVYNKTASNITVAKSEDGAVKVERKEVQQTKKVIPFASAKSSQYSSFVKAGAEENIEEEKDMSTKLSYDELFKICGGKTAHKGARHGLTMSAKLARVKQQEEDLMAKWQRTGDNPSTEADKLSIEKVEKSKKKGFIANNDEDALSHKAVNSCMESSELEQLSKKEKKLKKKKSDNTEYENGTDVKDFPDVAVAVDCDVETSQCKLSKKERKLLSKMNGNCELIENENADEKKSKKKKKCTEGENFSDPKGSSCSDESTINNSNLEINAEKLNGEQETEEKHIEEENVAKHTKKKKKRKIECENGNSEDISCIADSSDNQCNEPSETRLSKKEKKRLSKLNNQLETELTNLNKDESEFEMKQKKKKKKSKHKEQESADKHTQEENVDGDESAFNVKVSKKDKKRSRSESGVAEVPSKSSQIKDGSLVVSEELGNESFKKKKKKCKRERQDK